MKLLNVPFLLQNGAAPYFYESTEELLLMNPFISASLRMLQFPEVGRDLRKFLTDFIDHFPEFFGIIHTSNKYFTFVGAGFPVTRCNLA